MIKKFIAIIIALFFANNIYANKTDSLKINKWSIIISPNLSQTYHDYFYYPLVNKIKTGLIPGGTIGLQKRIINNDDFKYNIGLSIANFNTKKNLLYSDDNIMEIGDSYTYTVTKYNVKTEEIKDKYLNLLITPVNINLGILENHLYINYSLNINVNIYHIKSHLYKDKNDKVVYNSYNTFNQSHIIFDNNFMYKGVSSVFFDLLQNDVGFLFYPKYLKKYNIGVSLNLGFYFNPVIIIQTNMSNLGFYKYKIFHIDFIWKL